MTSEERAELARLRRELKISKSFPASVLTESGRQLTRAAPDADEAHTPSREG